MFSVLLIIMKEKLSQTDSGQNDNRFYSETIVIRVKRPQIITEFGSQYNMGKYRFIAKEQIGQSVDGKPKQKHQG